MLFNSCLFLCLCCRNAGLQFFLRNTPLWPFMPALPTPLARAPLSSSCGSLARWGFKHLQHFFNAHTHYRAFETGGQQVLNTQQFRSTSTQAAVLGQGQSVFWSVKATDVESSGLVGYQMHPTLPCYWAPVLSSHLPRSYFWEHSCKQKIGNTKKESGLT